MANCPMAAVGQNSPFAARASRVRSREYSGPALGTSGRSGCSWGCWRTPDHQIFRNHRSDNLRLQQYWFNEVPNFESLFQMFWAPGVLQQPQP